MRRPEHERRALAAHVHQLFYNQNRTALGRAINQTVETLKKLQDMNAKWPAHYPTVQRSQSSPPEPPKRDARPGLPHMQTMESHQDVMQTPARPETTTAC